MNALTLATNTIKGYANNKIIMDFVTTEAYEQVAKEIRKQNSSGTTAKAVELLAVKHNEIKERVAAYIYAGLVACYMKSLEVA